MQNETLSVGGVGIFSGTAHSQSEVAMTTYTLQTILNDHL